MTILDFKLRDFSRKPRETKKGFTKNKMAQESGIDMVKYGQKYTSKPLFFYNDNKRPSSLIPCHCTRPASSANLEINNRGPSSRVFFPPGKKFRYDKPRIKGSNNSYGCLIFKTINLDTVKKG